MQLHALDEGLNCQGVRDRNIKNRALYMLMVSSAVLQIKKTWKKICEVSSQYTAIIYRLVSH